MLKKSYSWICKKHDQTFISLTNVFDFTVQAAFRIRLHLMKSNGCVPLLNILYKNL